MLRVYIYIGKVYQPWIGSSYQLVALYRLLHHNNTRQNIATVQVTKLPGLHLCALYTYIILLLLLLL